MLKISVMEHGEKKDRKFLCNFYRYESKMFLQQLFYHVLSCGPEFVGLNGSCSSSSASWVIPGVFSHLEFSLEASQPGAWTTSTELGWTRPEAQPWAWSEPWKRRGIQDPPPLCLSSLPSLDSMKSHDWFRLPSIFRRYGDDCPSSAGEQKKR